MHRIIHIGIALTVRIDGMIDGRRRWTRCLARNGVAKIVSIGLDGQSRESAIDTTIWIVSSTGG